MPNFFDLSEDEDESDDEKSPFEQLAAKMFNITEDGGVKKRIKKQGFGGELKEGYVVQCMWHNINVYFRLKIHTSFHYL